MKQPRETTPHQSKKNKQLLVKVRHATWSFGSHRTSFKRPKSYSTFFLRKGFDMTTHWFIQERKQTA